MKKYGELLVLLLLASISCGFTWGLGRTDKCGEAKKSAQHLSAVKDDSKRKKEEVMKQAIPEVIRTLEP